MRQFFFVIAALFLSLPHGWAQSVQINRDVLEDYAPPAMFDAPNVVQDIEFEKPPKPTKKPLYISSLQPNGAKAAPVIAVDVANIQTNQELEVKTPSVREILAQIDPDAMLPPENAVSPPASDDKTRILAQPLPLAPDVFSFAFEPEAEISNSNLSPDMVESILARINLEPTARITLAGFASSKNEADQSTARRLSLARVIHIRDILIDKKIPSSIIDVRALGVKTDGAPLDQVDLIFTGR